MSEMRHNPYKELEHAVVINAPQGKPTPSPSTDVEKRVQALEAQIAAQSARIQKLEARIALEEASGVLDNRALTRRVADLAHIVQRIDAEGT